MANEKEYIKRFKLVLEEEKGSNSEVINQYLNRVKHFFSVVGVKDNYSKEDILYYIKVLRDSGGKESYIKFNYYILRSFFDAVGFEFPLRRVPKPRFGVVEEPLRTILSFGEVVQLITEGINVCSKYELAYLALSTTYGLRRVELAQINRNDFNWNEGRITIRTRKRGEVRTHFIPEEIKPYLKRYSFNENLKPVTLSKYFHNICEKCGVSVDERYGWHSIRRRLVIELDNTKQLTNREIHQFMRWKAPTETFSFIPITITYTERPTEELDLKIFSVHPFLKYWKV